MGMERLQLSVEQIVDRLRVTVPTLANSALLFARKKKASTRISLKSPKRRLCPGVRVDGEIYDVTEVPELSKACSTRLKRWWTESIKEGIRSRLFDSIEAALSIADGYVVIDTMDGKELLFGALCFCPACGFLLFLS